MLDPAFITLAHALADSAGEILRGYFRTQLDVMQKEDASPVTQADREVETIIREKIEAAFPDHGIFGEEFARRNDNAAYQWVIDPIDGTRAFIAGKTTFTTLIALTHNDIPVLGIIDQPITKERWVGADGKASCNGKPVMVRKAPALSDAVISTTSSDYFKPADAVRFARLGEAAGVIELGGDAYAYATLASGRLDIVADGSMKPYDYCALAPIVTGAGGVITDWDGKPLTIKSDGRVLAAGSAELHREALGLL